MTSFKPARLLAAAALFGALAIAPVMAQDEHPDATIHFSGGSVAFIGAVQWGGGELRFHGDSIPLRVNGIGVGAIGADSFSADGEVYHLGSVDDISGTYTALNASATAGAGSGEIQMQNEHGVVIHAHTSSAGLKLSLAPTGVVIHVK